MRQSQIISEINQILEKISPEDRLTTDEQIFCLQIVDKKIGARPNLILNLTQSIMGKFSNDISELDQDENNSKDASPEALTPPLTKKRKRGRPRKTSIKESEIVQSEKDSNEPLAITYPTTRKTIEESVSRRMSSFTVALTRVEHPFDADLKSGTSPSLSPKIKTKKFRGRRNCGISKKIPTKAAKTASKPPKIKLKTKSIPKAISEVEKNTEEYDESKDIKEFVIEKLLDKKISKGRVKYLVKFKGLSKSAENTLWLKEEDLGETNEERRRLTLAYDREKYMEHLRANPVTLFSPEAIDPAKFVPY